MRYDPPEGAGASISRRDVLSGLAALGTAALAGCSVDARLAPDGRLRIGTLEPPVTLDPIEAEYVGSKRAIALVFDGLYTYGEGTDVVPEIAAGDPEVGADGRQYAVEIDDSARFQNGDPVTATDVKYSFEAPATEDTANAWRVSMIESIETPDDRTVQFRLAEPYPAFDHVLALPVVPKAIREKDREAFASEPVGAGPFEVESFSEERKAGLDRWDDYWGDPAPALTGVTMVAFESPITQMTSLRTGRNNAIQPVAPQIADDVESVTDGTIQRRRGYTTYYLGFNLNEGPATDLDVRKGISRCIDLDEVVDQFVRPMGERAYSPLPPEVAAEWELPTDRWEELSTGKDVGRARQLFEESDHGGEIKILTPKDPRSKEIAEALAGGLRDAGRSPFVVSKPWKKYLESYVSGATSDYSVFVGSISGPPDPDAFLYPTFHENMIGATNGTFYDDDRTVERLAAGRRTRDRDRRRRHYEAAITRLLEERVLLPVSSFANSFATLPSVENLRVHPISAVNPRVAHGDDVVRIRSLDRAGGDR